MNLTAHFGFDHGAAKLSTAAGYHKDINGVWVDKNGNYPNANGQFPDKYGHYPDANGLYPNKYGYYADANGNYPNKSGQYPNTRGQYPNANGQYPNADGVYPDADGTYPSPTTTTTSTSPSSPSPPAPKTATTTTSSGGSSGASGTGSGSAPSGGSSGSATSSSMGGSGSTGKDTGGTGSGTGSGTSGSGTAGSGTTGSDATGSSTGFSQCDCCHELLALIAGIEAATIVEQEAAVVMAPELVPPRAQNASSLSSTQKTALNVRILLEGENLWPLTFKRSQAFVWALSSCLKTVNSSQISVLRTNQGAVSSSSSRRRLLQVETGQTIVTAELNPGSVSDVPNVASEVADVASSNALQKAFQQNQNGFKVDNATILSATATVPQSSSVTCTYGSLAGECVDEKPARLAWWAVLIVVIVGLILLALIAAMLYKYLYTRAPPPPPPEVKKPLIRPMSPSGPTPFYADSPHGGDFFKRGNIDTVPALPITPPASQQKAPATPGAPAPVATTAGTPQAAAKPPTPKAPSRPPSPRKEFVYPPPVFAPA
ncbi:hypothetical protein WJX84_000877 [Apatococcus fuscideae]|uniref:Uncharacterized protein n=1 Tax=Apatococcus fuscideae TaxID=2026836 RepID=A0AAW1SLF5_9CHLO